MRNKNLIKLLMILINIKIMRIVQNYHLHYVEMELIQKEMEISMIPRCVGIPHI